MLDKLLWVGGLGGDWLRVLWAFLGDLRHGLGTGFIIPLDCGWSGRDIERLLREKGIRTWGLLAGHDVLTLQVKRSQVRSAVVALRIAGIPFDAGPLP